LLLVINLPLLLDVVMVGSGVGATSAAVLVVDGSSSAAATTWAPLTGSSALGQMTTPSSEKHGLHLPAGLSRACVSLTGEPGIIVSI
jgi:hypothetical protein